MYNMVILVDGTDVPSRGAYQIAFHLRKHGYKVKVIQYVSYYTEEQLTTLVDRFVSPGTILGLSCTFVEGHQWASMMKFVEIARKRYPEAKLVLGGVDEIVARNITHDFNLTGIYPEDKVVDFMNSQFGRIKKLPFNIATLDFKYEEDDAFPQGSVLPIEISRHCVFNCKFCNYHNRGMKMSDRNYDLVIDEMKDAYQRFGTSKFVASCSTFNDREEKLEGLFSRFDQLDFPVEINGFIRFELLLKQEKYWPWFKKYFKHMKLGLETFNHESGKTIGKGMHPDKVKAGLLKVREYMPDTYISSGFIIGLPHDTPEDQWGVVKWVQETKGLDSAHFYPLIIHPKLQVRTMSDFDLHVEKYGYTVTEHTDQQSIQTEWTRADGFTFQDARALRNEIAKAFPQPMSAFESMFLSQWYNHAQMLEFGANFRAVGKQHLTDYAAEYYKLL